MLSRVADIIANNVEAITRAWVADLRQTPDTEIHNTLLSHQIVDGVKGMLGALARTIRAGQAPDAESAAIAAALAARDPASLPVAVPNQPSAAPGSGRYPTLPGPLEQMQRYARTQGRTRQQQGYEVHEVIHEYIVLRSHILETLHNHLRSTDRPMLDLALYLNRLLDDLLLNAVKSYHESVIADLERRATRDTMTGLYNHEYFQERLEQEIHSARRRDEPLSLLMIDVDLLKQVNDTYGHTSGDLLLLTVVEALRSSLRETDLVCRYGGDEFTVILPNTTYAQTEILIERIRVALDRPIALQLELFPADGQHPQDEHHAAGESAPHLVHPSASIGIAAYPQDARTAQTLIAQADAAMYRMKQQRRAQPLLPRTKPALSSFSHRDESYELSSN